MEQDILLYLGVINMEIHNLFPTPIYTSNINRKFTEKELIFVKNQKKNTRENVGSNLITTNKNILDEIEFKEIKIFLEKSCQDYLDKIICPLNDVKLYITESWLNYTEENQYHHEHTHPNSIISGVLYIDSDKDNDKIKFIVSQNSYSCIHPDIDKDKFNIWNSSSWWFPVETGKLIMFRSSTIHKVENKKGSNTRISLAFNTFYKGTLGNSDSSTKLIL
jgi:uncharacterized protein (TIGR02466 family)|tara:strand:- start:2664 stop:3323 length:660 start_codon:yes stop_codon:yes gene_type:complete